MTRLSTPFCRALSATLLSLLFACVTEVPEEPVGAEAAIVDGVLERARHEVIFLYNIRGAACTGTIIAPRVVLTAKHCVQNGTAVVPASELRVLVGPSTSNLRAQYNVAEVRVAPGRSDLQDASDVAVLILTSDASETPMEVSFDSPFDIVGETFTAVGYGQTPSGGSGVKYTADKRVQGVMRGFIFVNPSVCSGDSGGPLIGADGRVWGVASFIYSEDRGSPRCGTAPGAYNNLNRWRDLIEGAIEDTGSCIPDEEICNGVDDNCDDRIDEGCQPLGATCSNDSECFGGLCDEIEGTRVCTAVCDPLRPAVGCATNMYCANVGGCGGRCAVGTPEGGEIEDECTSDTQCITGYCTDPGDGRRRCLVPCQGDAGTCLSGEVCAAPPGACGGCVPEELVNSVRGIGEACDGDENCGSGICFDDEGFMYCSRACTEDADCGDAFHCRGDRCARGPRANVGESCVTNDDCADGICASRGGDVRWCTSVCGECPDGFACEPAGDTMVCSPVLGLIGDECAESADCVTNFCAGIEGEMICTRLCGSDLPCAAGQECVRADGRGTAVCVPRGDARSGVDGDGGGCAASASSRGTGQAGLFAIAMLGILLRRRR